MNSILLMACLCVPLLFGCSKAENKKAPVNPSAPEQAGRIAEPKTPYYPGLIGEYRAILADDPNNLATLIALGNAYFDSGQWKNAVTMYEHALMIDPRNADVRSDLGTAYRHLGMSERALAEYHLALEHEPGHLNARYNTGIVYAYDKKNYRAAIAIWEELLRLAPNYPEAERIRSNIESIKKESKKGDK
jgi:tetratricopeptide (TPR) repeat protein